MLTRKVLLIAAGAVAALGLRSRLGTWPGLAAWAAVTGVTCAVAALLLRTSTPERITWRNRVAAWLLPWGYRLSGGKLLPLTLVAWAVWVLIGTAAAVLAVGGGRTVPPGAHPVRSILLFISWLIYGAILLHLLNLRLNVFPSSPQRREGVLSVTVVVLVLLLLSVALVLTGRPGWALLVVGGPLGLFVGVYGSYFVYFTIVLNSRNARWR